MKTKKVILMALLSVLLFTICTRTEAATYNAYDSEFNELLSRYDREKHTISIDEIDALIVTVNRLYAQYGEDYMDAIDVSNRVFVPLYNDRYDVVAYYLEFESGGYAVINNNVLNPFVIEFGKKNNSIVHEYLASDSDTRIIYDSPVSVRTETIDGNYDFSSFNDLNVDSCEKDLPHAKMLYEKKQSLIKRDEIKSFGSYPDWGVYYVPGYDSEGTGRKLKYATNQSWMTGGMFQESSNSNEQCCGTIAGTNLALVFTAMGYNKLKNNTTLNTFYDVSSYIPIGITVTIADECCDYFDSKNYELNYDSYNIVDYTTNSMYNTLKTAINSNKPCIISVLKPAVLPVGHWMVAIGWREYDSYKYIQVLNGWDDSEEYFFRINSIPLMSVTKYYVSCYNNDAGSYVSRHYSVCLSRDPDLNGLINWVNALLNNTAGGGKVAKGFFFGQEYINLNKSDSAFVTDLYLAMLNRTPSSSEVSTWTSALNSGYTRLQVFNGFANSVEFSNKCASYGISA
jgi:hypothetical protein